MSNYNYLAQYGVLWYFYSEAPMDHKLQRMIVQNYAKLGLQLRLLKSIQKLREIRESILWKSKLFARIVLRKESPDKIAQADEVFEKEQFTIFEFYDSQEELQKFIKKSYEEMGKFKESNGFEDSLLIVSKKQWNLFRSKFMYFYAVLSDPLFSKQCFEQNFRKSFEQIRNRVRHNAESMTMEDYRNKGGYQSFIRTYHRELHTVTHCEFIGDPVKKIYSFVRQQFLKNNQYQKLKDVHMWRFLWLPLRDRWRFAPDQFYLHKTIRDYRASLYNLIDAEFKSEENLAQIMKKTKQIALIKIVSDGRKQSKLIQIDSNLTHGYFMFDEGQKITLNCMNILKLRSAELRSLSQLLTFQSSFVIREIEDHGTMIFVLEFQLVDLGDVLRSSIIADEESSNEEAEWVQKQCSFLVNTLKRHCFKPTVEDVLLQDGKGAQIWPILQRRRQRGIPLDRKYCELIGQQHCILEQIKEQRLNKQNIAKGLSFSKGIENRGLYLRLLHEYIELLEGSDNAFDKYVQRGFALVKMAELIALNLSNQQRFYGYLSEVVDIIDELSPELSGRTEVERKYRPRGCFDKLLCRPESKGEEEIRREYDGELMERYFKREPKGKREKFLNKLRADLCKLFTSLKKTVTEIFRCGRKSAELTNLRFTLNGLGEDFRGDYAQSQIRSSDMALIEKIVGAEAIDDSEYKLSNIQIALRENRTVLEESFEQMSVLLRYPLKECTFAESKDIVFDNRELHIINWEQTKLTLFDRVVKEIEIASEETDRHFEYLKKLNPSEKAVAEAIEASVSICDLRIRHLTQDHYKNHSVAIMRLLKQKMRSCFMLKDAVGLEELQKTDFEHSEKRHVLLLKAELYDKMAILCFEREDYERCEDCAVSSLEFYNRADEETAKKILTLILLRFRARTRLLAGVGADKERQKSQIRVIKQQMAQQISSYVSKYGEDAVKIYLIEAELLSVNMEQILKAKSFEQILRERMRIKKELAYFYSDYELHSVRINIEILLQYFIDGRIVNDWPQLQGISASIERAFGKSSEKDDSELADYRWIKHLNLFFRERAKDCKFIEVLPARTHIEQCLHFFKELNAKGRLSVEHRVYYEKIFGFYKAFMERWLKYFPKKENIFAQRQQQQTTTNEIEVDEDLLKNNCSHFSRVFWIVLLPRETLPQETHQSLKRLYNNKYAPIIDSVRGFIQTLKAIWELNKDSHKFTAKGDANIKIVTNTAFINEIRDLNYMTYLVNAVEVNVLVERSAVSVLEEIKAYFHMKQTDIKLRIIYKIQEKIGEITEDAKQFCESYALYNNALFYIKGFTDKIHRLNIIAHSSIEEQSYEEQFVGSDTALKRLKFEFMNAFQSSKPDNTHQFLRNAQSFKEIRLYLSSLKAEDFKKDIEAHQQRLMVASHRVLADYQSEGLVYAFVNNTLRSINNGLDFDWGGLRKLIHPLYHAVRHLYSTQFQTNREKLGKILTLYRYAQMKAEEFDLFREMAPNRPPIKFFQFLSTSYSLGWVIDRVRQLVEDNAEKTLAKFAIFAIRIELTEDLLTQDSFSTNHGFCEMQNQYESEVVFNILNIFRVEGVKQATIGELLSNQREENEKYPKNRPLFGQRVRFIELSMENYASILKQKQQRESRLGLFQEVESTFLKRLSFGLRQANGIQASNYSIVEAYEDLGQPQRAKLQIESSIVVAINEPLKGERMLRKVSSICLKMGNLGQAKEYLQNFLPQLNTYKDRIQNETVKLDYEDDLFEMKESLISIYGERLEINEYLNNIQRIDEEIRLRKQGSETNLNYKTKEIYLLLHRSIHYFQSKDFDESLDCFEKTLHRAQTLIRDMKEAQKNSAEGGRIERAKRHFQTILYRLNERMFLYKTVLNKNTFGSAISKFSKSLGSTSNSFFKDCENSDLQNNAACVGAAVLNMETESNAFFDIVQRLSEESEMLSQASSEMESESHRLQQRLSSVSNIKFVNFRLLGQLQTEREKFIGTSSKNMTAIAKKYHQTVIKLFEGQIEELRKEGHARESMTLAKVYNKILRQKFIQDDCDSKGLHEQITKGIVYCRGEDGGAQLLETCGLHILRAELSFRMAEDELTTSRYRNTDRAEQLYQQAQSSLREADASLRSACNLKEQGFRQRFKWSQSKEYKMHRLSYENLSIKVLNLKIKHRRFLSAKVEKRQLIDALSKLGSIISEMSTNFVVVNEQILLNQIYCIYGLILPKEITFENYSEAFLRAMAQRERLRVQNNIENAFDCLQIFELLHSKLREKVPRRDYDAYFRYIERGTRSSENNELFWRFVICKFNKITKGKKSDEEYCLHKLGYVQEVFTLLLSKDNVKQFVFERIFEAFERFNRNFILKNKIQSQRVQKKIQNIQALYACKIPNFTPIQYQLASTIQRSFIESQRSTLMLQSGQRLLQQHSLINVRNKPNNPRYIDEKMIQNKVEADIIQQIPSSQDQLSEVHGRRRQNVDVRGQILNDSGIFMNQNLALLSQRKDKIQIWDDF